MGKEIGVLKIMQDTQMRYLGKTYNFLIVSLVVPEVTYIWFSTNQLVSGFCGNSSLVRSSAL
jgi:hypothetical protein